MHNQYECNPIRGPINAWFFEILEGYMDRLFGSSKRKLFENHPDTIVEIGPGAGANMRYFKKGTRLIAIEPNIYMHASLRKAAITHGINLEIRSVTGESIVMCPKGFRGKE